MDGECFCGTDKDYMKNMTQLKNTQGTEQIFFKARQVIKYLTNTNTFNVEIPISYAYIFYIIKS